MAGFNLPTTQPVKKEKEQKSVKFDAIDFTEEDTTTKKASTKKATTPKKATPKKAEKAPEKKKDTPKKTKVSPISQVTKVDTMMFFSPLTKTEKRSIPLSARISKENLDKLNKLSKAGFGDKSKSAGAILRAFNVEEAITNPAFYVANLGNDTVRNEPFNVKLTPSEYEKLGMVAQVRTGNFSLALDSIISLFDVDVAIENLEEE
jgi:hypothetical protein